VNDTIAVILARKGSKRIPGKNTINFLGKPMIQYTIENLKKWGKADIIISTDDDKAKEVAQKNNVAISDRKDGGDDVTMYQSLRDVLKHAHHAKYLLAYACCPFDIVGDLDRAYQMLSETDMVTTLQPCSRERYIFDDRLIPQGNSLDLRYTHPGQFFMGWIDPLMEGGTIFVRNKKAIIIDWKEGQDINYPEDLEIAKLKLKS